MEEPKVRKPRKPRKVAAPAPVEAHAHAPIHEEQPAPAPAFAPAPAPAPAPEPEVDPSEIGTVPSELLTGVNLTPRPAMEVHPHVAKRITQFIMVRDRIEQIEEEHKRQLAPLKDILVQLHNDLLKSLTELGIDSVAVRGVGTAYRSERHSVSITDPTQFKEFVITEGAWNLLDWKANVTMVRVYATRNGEVPPGVNLSSRVIVNVRKNP
jgi:hypothetical protein